MTCYQLAANLRLGPEKHAMFVTNSTWLHCLIGQPVSVIHVLLQTHTNTNDYVEDEAKVDIKRVMHVQIIC